MSGPDDRGFWVSWYDLPEDRTDDHLAWVHGTYIPKILARPGVLWAAHYKTRLTNPGAHMHRTKDASVPDGSDYVLIFGGRDTATFASTRQAFHEGAPRPLDEELTADDHAMLAMRKGQRQSILAEEMRFHGPEGAPKDGQIHPGGCIQFGSFNCPPEAEDELLAWYADYRLPALAKADGFIRARKLVATTGWARHVIMYEFPDVAARQSAQAIVEERDPEGLRWTHTYIPALVHAPRSPVLAERIWPARG